jgi:hypothetical protein
MPDQINVLVIYGDPEISGATLTVTMDRREMGKMIRTAKGSGIDRSSAKDFIIYAMKNDRHTDREAGTAMAACVSLYIVEHPQAELLNLYSFFAILITETGPNDYNFRLLGIGDEIEYKELLNRVRKEEEIIVIRGR